jgi:hypothetical protein
MLVTIKDTLTEAMPSRDRPGAVGLILSLEGARYSVFVSEQTRDQVASSSVGGRAGVGGKIDLHRELLGRFGNPQPALAPMARQAEYLRILPAARAVAATTGMDPEGRHAEESMIELWDQSVNDFLALRGWPPAKAEAFLTHCPCQVTNAVPSTAKHLNGFAYPASCYEKLKTFCASGNRVGMNWNVYFDHPFGGLALDVVHGNLRIRPRPVYINMPG